MKASFTHSNPKQVKGFKQPKAGKHSNVPFQKKQKAKVPTKQTLTLPKLDDLLKGN